MNRLTVYLGELTEPDSNKARRLDKSDMVSSVSEQSLLNTKEESYLVTSSRVTELLLEGDIAYVRSKSQRYATVSYDGCQMNWLTCLF